MLYSGLLKAADRAEDKLLELSSEIKAQREEFKLCDFHYRMTKAAIANLPKMTRAIVEKSMSEMEGQGYQFPKRKAGSTQVYNLTIENVNDIYLHRGVPTYKDTFDEACVVFVSNLKGGVSKTVSTVTLAHALRTHDALIKENLRILVIDLDPQSSSTLFLNHEYATGEVNNTSTQAMLTNPTREELLNEFVCHTMVPGVDVMPANIDDAFIASNWNDLCAEHVPEQAVNSILKENIVDKLKHDYDFILLDSGPHLDSMLTNCISAADILATPIPPAQVDFHSTLKYIMRIPGLIESIEEEGTEVSLLGHIAFMSKITTKSDHMLCHGLAKEVFGSDMLDASLPRLDGFERCGESFDTVISSNPKVYPGSPEALKKAKVAAELFALAFFQRIQLIRGMK